MKFANLGSRLLSYGLVGLLCAGVYTTALISLRQFIPEWSANPLAFLIASYVGSIGHSKYTFHPETGGQKFASRWIIIQYLTNIAACTSLPLLLPSFDGSPIRLAILVFTPTVINAVLWSGAAQFSARRNLSGAPPKLHADDLGLSSGTDYAICQLAEQFKLDGCSLLVNGPTSKEGSAMWLELEKARQDLRLCLHLCLTEGPPSSPRALVPDLINNQGFLNLGFGTWLFISTLPSFLPLKRRIYSQLKTEVKAQINRYKLLTGKQQLQLDGHQHVHLIPMVRDCILNEAQQAGIVWMRTTHEPLPTGLPLHYWWDAFRKAGFAKWLLLNMLSALSAKPLIKANISTNQNFGGVLFTGQMDKRVLKACSKELSIVEDHVDSSSSLLLAHPAAQLTIDLTAEGFHISHQFALSQWRGKEWAAMQSFSFHQP